MVQTKTIIDALRAQAEELNDVENVSVTYREWDKQFDVSVIVNFLMPESDGGSYWESETDTEILTRGEALDRTGLRKV